MSNFIQKIYKQETKRLFKQKYGEYAIKIISDRAVVSIDGVKPVHRRILYAMDSEKLVQGKKMKKSLNAVSATLKLHPHGDSSVYGALVRMSQPWKQNIPLIEFNGNNGSIFNSGDYAAFRYTYSRLSQTAMDMLDGIEKNAVDIIPSDGDEDALEPVILPSKFPAIFVNGTMGIGVGITSNIPPHNVNNVIKMLDAYVENEDMTSKELFEILGGPEFPVDSIIMNKNELLEVYEKGKGRIVARGNYEIKGDKIIFTSLPYNVDISTVLEALEKLGEKNSLPDVVDFANESTEKDGVKLIFSLKKNANPNDTLAVLFAKTSLKKTFSCSFYVLIDGLPKLLSLRELVVEYVKHLRTCLIRETEFDLAKFSADLHIFEGYAIVLDNIDKAIEIIRGSMNKEFAKIELMNFFKITDIQANKVLELRLAKLTSMEIDKIRNEIDILKDKITDLNDIKVNYFRQGQIISKNLNGFTNNRVFSTIIEDEINLENTIVAPLEDIYVLLTKDGLGYCGVETSHKDFPSNVIQIIKTNTHANLFIVSEEGKLEKRNILELTPIKNKITPLTKTIDNAIGIFTDDTEYASYVTELGVVRSLPVSEYTKKRVTVFSKVKSRDRILKVVNSSGTVVVTMENGNRIFVNEIGEKNLVGVIYCGEKPTGISPTSAEYIIITSENRCRKIELEQNLVNNRSKGLSIGGKLNEGEIVLDICVAENPCLINGKLIEVDSLSNRFKKM